MYSVTEITNDDDFNAYLNGTNKYVFVDFYASWCGPCKKIEPDIKKMSAENEDVVFLKVNVDTVPALAKKYKISAMPTFLLFEIRENEAPTYKRLVGADVNKIKNFLKSRHVVINNDDDMF